MTQIGIDFGGTKIATGSKKPLEALYIEIGAWRHYVVSDSYHHVHEAFGAARAAEPHDE